MSEDRDKVDESSQKGVTRRSLLGAAVTTGVGAVLAPLVSSPNPASAAPAGPPPPAPIDAGGPVPMKLHINGQTYWVQLEPRVTLLDALRDHLGLFGSKKGCDQGQCGACTVLINGRRIDSCLTLAVMHQADEITTIEGLADGDHLHPVQAAFVEHDAFQCGYCTPGQICSAVGMIHEGHAHTDDEVREAMAGNICRCGAYPHIVAAIQDARRSMS